MKGEFKLKRNDIFYIAFFLYTIYAFINTTMITDIVPSMFLNGLRYISLIFLFLKILMDKYSNKNIIIYAIVISAFILSIIYSSYMNLFDVLLFIIAAKDVEIDVVVKINFWSCLIMLLLTMLMAQLNIIENLVYYRGTYREIKRISFGCIYPTDFAAHVFYLVLAYIYMKKGKLKLNNYIVIILCSVFIYKFCDARLDSITILLALLIVFFYSKFNSFFVNNMFIKKVLKFSFIICGIIMLFLTLNYDYNNKFYKSVNSILSNRLQIGNYMVKENGILLFGQKVEMHGFGRNTKFNYEKYEYNYVDSSYIRIMLLYGIFIFIIISLGNIYLCDKSIKKNNYIIPLMMFLISINSMIAQHYFDF